jgi:hypothetical protein
MDDLKNCPLCCVLVRLGNTQVGATVGRHNSPSGRPCDCSGAALTKISQKAALANPCTERRLHQHLYFPNKGADPKTYVFISEEGWADALSFAQTKGSDCMEAILTVGSLGLAKGYAPEDMAIFAGMIAVEGDDFDAAITGTGGLEGLV